MPPAAIRRPAGVAGRARWNLAMSPFAILILSLSMSADAFAAALARGASARPGWTGAIRGGLVFGVIEAITPLLGWALGRAAQGLVEQWDHWVAFVLLTIVGAHMIRNGLKGEPHIEEEAAPSRKGGVMMLALTAVGTSIDAAAVGVGLAMIDVNILVIAAAIGVSTFVCTTIGLRMGGKAGETLGARVELVAGIALIGLGLGILGKHTGFLYF